MSEDVKCGKCGIFKKYWHTCKTCHVIALNDRITECEDIIKNCFNICRDSYGVEHFNERASEKIKHAADITRAYINKYKSNKDTSK